MRYALMPIVATHAGGWVSHVSWWELLYRGSRGAVNGHQCATPQEWREWYAALPALLPRLFPRYQGVRLSVNVSTMQLLDSGIRDNIRRLAHCGPRLALEWTEDPLDPGIQGVAEAATYLCFLRREYDVAIGIDDLGAGEDGFGRIMALRELPDFVKYDGSVLAIAQEARGLHALLRGHIHVYRKQGVSVVGEKIETRQQVDIAGQLGMNFLQGFFFNEWTETYGPASEASL